MPVSPTSLAVARLETCHTAVYVPVLWATLAETDCRYRTLLTDAKGSGSFAQNLADRYAARYCFHYGYLRQGWCHHASFLVRLLVGSLVGYIRL